MQAKSIEMSFQRAFRFVILGTLFLVLLQRSEIEINDPVERVRAFTRSIEFDYATWVLDAWEEKIGQIGLGAADYLDNGSQKSLVLDYLDTVTEIQQKETILQEYYTNPDVVNPEAETLLIRKNLESLYEKRSILAPLAEAVLQNQISAVIADKGLTLGGQPLPPLMFHITPLPMNLIVYPRDVIRQDADISLNPNITVDQITALEDKVDHGLNVSSLVVPVGGIGLYPTMVMQTSNLNWLLEVISHEWTHNYLDLRPLGLSYYASPELRTMNETTANISGKEIGAAVIERYYPEFVPPPKPEEKPPMPEKASEPPAFDFRAAMHETRVTVDKMLVEGKIEEAESYMESQRRMFWDHGYHIRKLNQAYFAFYGAYADVPGGAAGEDPVGAAVRTLRAQSNSLVEFLNRISWMWSFEQLKTAIRK